MFAELAAPIEVRLERNHHPERALAKPRQASTLSDEIMLGMEKHRFLSEPGELDEFGPSLRIDTTGATPGQAAARIVAEFGLPKVESRP